MKVDRAIRRATEAHHSGTHVLNAALKKTLGDHIKQSGSLVNPERLRFDFTHFSRIDEAEMDRLKSLPIKLSVKTRRSKLASYPGRGHENGSRSGF